MIRLCLKSVASGLTPGKHGIHIHDKAIVGNDFTTAGGHFNPLAKQHGEHNPDGAHLGDLSNLVVDENGKVDQTFILSDYLLKKER